MPDTQRSLARRLYRSARQWLLQNTFVQNISVLAGGAALGQAIVALSSPIVTHLFTPEEFGILAVYTSILMIVGGVATLRYNYAIPLPEDEETGINLLVLALLLVPMMAALTGGAVVRYAEELARLFEGPQAASYLWLIGVGVLGRGAYHALNYWAIRVDAYDEIAKTRVSQGTSKAATHIGLGLLGAGPIGLIVGQIIGQTAGVSTLARTLWRRRQALRKVSLRKMAMAASRYRRFPLFASWSTLLNSSVFYLPHLFLAGIYGLRVAGWFMLAERVVRTPVVLVGRATSQAYFGKAADLRHQGPRDVRALFAKIVKRLALLSALPALLLAILGPWIFTLVFGEEWLMAGRYVQVLTLMLFVRFSIAPVAQTLNILEMQDVQMFWEAGRLVLVLGVFYLSYAFQWPSLYCIGAYSAGIAATYVALFATCWFMLSEERED